MRARVAMIAICSLLFLGGFLPAAGGREKPAGGAADSGQDSGLPARVGVFVSIPPQEDFVQRIGGERVAVQALVSAGQNPHSYEPAPKQIARLSEAAVYFSIGVDFERGFLPKLRGLMPGLPVIDAARGIEKRAMEAAHRHEDEEGPEEAPDHQVGKDPHVWLSPNNVKTIARNIRDGLIQVDPAGRQIYHDNTEAFLRELDELRVSITEILEPVRGREFLVFHPAFGYFADEFGLEQVPIEIEGKSPSARQLTEVIEHARQEGIRVIFVQPQFDRKSAQAIADAIGGAVVPIDPLARDYLANMKQMARAVEAGLKRP